MTDPSRVDASPVVVKVFSATKISDRSMLGAEVTAWLTGHPDYRVARMTVTQSSDCDYHCLSVTLFCELGRVDRIRRVVEVFTASLSKDRSVIGDVATEWLVRSPGISVDEHFVVQSSDDSYHCLSIVFLCSSSGAVADARQIKDSYSDRSLASS